MGCILHYINIFEKVDAPRLVPEFKSITVENWTGCFKFGQVFAK